MRRRVDDEWRIGSGARSYRSGGNGGLQATLVDLPRIASAQLAFCGLFRWSWHGIDLTRKPAP